MAVKTVTNDGSQNFARLFTWATMANLDTGTPVEANEYGDRTVQVTGTFGVGGSISFEGSNDNTNWVILRDPFNAALTFTAAGLKAMLETPRYVRPNVTAGDGSTALVPTMWTRRTQR